jgi:hypothetical protein
MLTTDHQQALLLGHCTAALLKRHPKAAGRPDWPAFPDRV